MKVTINRAFGTPITAAKMSGKEALDLDGRARKEGSVWETRIKANPEKIRSSRTTMSNADIQVDKKVDNNTPKQSPTAKNKAVGISRQRSDSGIKKPPLQIKRSRSAAATSVRDEINLVKLRKIKSDSAKNIDVKLENSLPLELVEVDQQTMKSDDETVVKAITNNADVDCIDEDEEVEKEIEVEVENTSLQIKDLTISLEEEKPKKLAIVEKKLLHSNDRSPPIVKKIAPATRIHPTPSKLNPISDHHHGASSRLQSLADLIMWRDVSRSAFVFGIGTFAIISSSFTKDLNISCISVLSYLGLVYLAVSFTIRSLITRENIDMDSTDEEYVVGEEEAIRKIKLVLPYLNEFLSKLRSLFSGDPATTMKLAVLLFILARCGGSITIWKMTKLGFFGVFLLPKLCSSYSSQLGAYCTFWIGRFGDAWESCSYKKGAAFGIFSLVWNLSSVVARLWTLFLLFVAFRYYQNSRIKEEHPLTHISHSKDSNIKIQNKRW